MNRCFKYIPAEPRQQNHTTHQGMFQKKDRIMHGLKKERKIQVFPARNACLPNVSSGCHLRCSDILKLVTPSLPTTEGPLISQALRQTGAGKISSVTL